MLSEKMPDSQNFSSRFLCPFSERAFLKRAPLRVMEEFLFHSLALMRAFLFACVPPSEPATHPPFMFRYCCPPSMKKKFKPCKSRIRRGPSQTFSPLWSFPLPLRKITFSLKMLSLWKFIPYVFFQEIEFLFGSRLHEFFLF